MRALILLLPISLALAGPAAPLDEAVKKWESDSPDERELGSRIIAEHVARELAPVVAALKSPDPEVRLRARTSLESLLPPRPPEPPMQEQWAQRWVIAGQRQQQARILLNAQGQLIVMQGDQAEIQQLQERGVTGVPVDDPVMRAQLCLAEGRGFAVTAVAPRTQAARLGIEALDVLISIDGRPVKQWDEVLKGLGARFPEIKLMRRGKMITLGAREGEGAPGEGK